MYVHFHMAEGYFVFEATSTETATAINNDLADFLESGGTV